MVDEPSLCTLQCVPVRFNRCPTRALTATFTDPPLSDDQVASIAEWVSVVDEDFTQALIPEVAA